MEASEILSAFVDGEPVEPAELLAALGTPGARETLVDFVQLRTAVADDSRPSEAFTRRMRGRLAVGSAGKLSRMLRMAAALAIVALAMVGAYDLVRGVRPQPGVDEPPAATRVIRFEPGVDWKPVQGR